MTDPDCQKAARRTDGPSGSLRLNDPALWGQVSAAIGDHPYSYDLSDDSHRLDVVQIVCAALARVVLG